MSLSISNFFQAKSVKLSDSFIVTLTFPEEDPISLVNCTGFTVPKIEYNEEILYYGNVSQAFLIPKYDSVKEMSIKFLESQNDSILQRLIRNEDFEGKGNSSFLNLGNGYRLEQKRATNGYSINYGYYNIDDFDLEELRIDIYDNNFNSIIYSYLFNNLKIIKYEMYDLDYSNESPCEVNMSFMFEGYAKGANITENEKFTKIKNLPQSDYLQNQFKIQETSNKTDSTNQEKRRQILGRFLDLNHDKYNNEIDNTAVIGSQLGDSLTKVWKKLEDKLEETGDFKVKVKLTYTDEGDTTELDQSHSIAYEMLVENFGKDFIDSWIFAGNGTKDVGEDYVKGQIEKLFAKTAVFNESDAFFNNGAELQENSKTIFKLITDSENHDDEEEKENAKSLAEAVQALTNNVSPELKQ